MNGPIKLGDTVHVEEADYCYGIGRLTIRITEMARSDEGPAWIKVRGIEIGWNGEERGEREVVARITGMKRVAS